MRFVAVNTSSAKGEMTWCAFCTKAIGKSYVRDLQTRCVYHNVWCLEAHVLDSLIAIEGNRHEAYR